MRHVQALLGGIFGAARGIERLRIACRERARHPPRFEMRSARQSGTSQRPGPARHRPRACGGSECRPQTASASHWRRWSKIRCPALNRSLISVAELPRFPVMISCGSRLAMATPTCCGRGVQLRLRRAHVGTPLDELRRHAERQIGGQHQLIQFEASRLEFGGQVPGKDRQRIARLMQLLVQRRQGALQLRKRRILGKNVRLCDRAQFELAAQDRRATRARARSPAPCR